MTHDEITAKINALTLKDGITVKYNFDKYGSTQVEIREESGSLIWRGWSFEADFAFYLDRELDRYGVSKSAEEIAEQAASARASRLRNDAIFFARTTAMTRLSIPSSPAKRSTRRSPR